MIETSIERIQGEDYCNIYTGERKFVNQILQFKQTFPNEVELKDYGDGCVCAKVPSNWLRFVKPPTKRNYTAEQRQAAKERMKKAREVKGKK